MQEPAQKRAIALLRRKRANDVFSILQKNDADCRLTAALTQVSVTQMAQMARVLKDAPKGHAQMADCASSGSCVPMAPDFPAGPVPDCSNAAPDFTNCSLNGGE